jgi:hypothetical protein
MSDMSPPPLPPPGAAPPPPTGGYPAGQQFPPGGYGFPANVYGPGRQLGKRRSAALVLLLCLVTCGIWVFVWAYQNGDELNRWSGKGLGGGLHLVITIFVSPVTMFLLAGEVEQLYRDDGQEPPITTLWGLWFLLPLIGHLIWYVRIQNSINDFWTAKGAAPSTGAT